MLTKTDLSQIRKIVREEVETEVKSARDDLQGEIKLARIEIQKEIRSFAGRLKNVEIAIKKIQKDIKKIVNFFDAEYLQVRKRIERIENYLKMPPTP